MTELEDLRGRAFSWLRTGDGPLMCQLYEGSQIVGSLSRPGLFLPTRVDFAGVHWRVETSRRWLQRHDRVAFERGGPVVAECGTGWDLSLRLMHTLTIDGTESYKLHQRAPIIQARHQQAAWCDGSGREVVTFERLGHSRDSGEAKVSVDLPLTHAPILVFVGVLRALGGGIFPSEE